MARKKAQKYYAVARGRHVGIFSDWMTCSYLVSGYPYAKYEKFDTYEEAREYMIEERNLYIDPWELDKEIF